MHVHRNSSRRRLARYLGLFVVIASSTLPRTAAAQYAETGYSTVPEYTLKQHRFLMPTLLPSAFVSTNARFQQGFSYYQVSDFPFTRRRSFDIDAIGVTERLSVGFRFLDLMQVYLMGQAQLLTGVNVKSVVLAGTTYNYVFGGGLAARLFRSTDSGTQLSLRAQVTTGPLGQLDLLALASNIVDRQLASVEDLFDAGIARSSLASGRATVFRAQAVAAQTLSRNFGVQAFLGLVGYWETVSVYDPEDEQDVDSDATSWSPEGGVSLEATLLPGVPLGFNLEYAFEAQRHNLSDSEGAQDTQLQHTVCVGVHVVDSRFQIGLSLGGVFGLDPAVRHTLRNEELKSGTPTSAFGQFQMQYLW
jgi:hypothetical protein